MALIGRNIPRLLKQFIPLIISFLLGYIIRSFSEDSLPSTTETIENDFPLFTGPSSTLLVLVISSPGNTELRNTIRETWLSVSKKNHNFKAFFVIGERSLNSKQIYDLSQEKFRYDDLMLLPIHDSYGSLTTKVLKSFEYSHKNVKFEYVLKCDDDTFVDLERVISELKSFNDPSLYWGFFDGRAPVQSKGKWADPKYKMCDKYIPYALGGGYVLGKHIVQFLAENSKMLELFNSEDASVGTWLAGAKVNRKHDTRFDTEWRSRGCSNKFIVTHKQTEADMKIKWKRLMKYGSICEGAETKVRLSYNYDWSRPPSECCIRSDHSLP